MAKPAHAAIKLGDSSETAIVFVASRSLCRAVGLDLLTQCSLESEAKRGYLSSEISENLLERQLVKLQDQSLQDFVSRGIGFFHPGISKPDRNLMLELYAEGIIRVFIVSRESCWALPIRASVVVVMGTQYSYSESEGSERQIRDYELPELVQMQGRAVRHGSSGHFHLFCQSEARDTFTRFLNEGLPLESRLLETQDLEIWFRHQRSKGWIADRQQTVDALSFTFLARRVVTNAAYYDMSSTSLDASLSRIADRLEARVTPDSAVP
jgi:antiviral helicase SLH1